MSHFILGNDVIHTLTSNYNYSLQWDIKLWNGKAYNASWSQFVIASESEGYRLSVDMGWRGTVGSGFSMQSGKMWSTLDKDNDGDASQNCAITSRGPWWFDKCASYNLNSVYWLNGSCPLNSCGQCIHINELGSPCSQPIQTVTMKISRL